MRWPAITLLATLFWSGGCGFQALIIPDYWAKQHKYEDTFHPMIWTAPRWYGVAKNGECRFVTFVQDPETREITSETRTIPENNRWVGTTPDGRTLSFICYANPKGSPIKPAEVGP